MRARNLADPEGLHHQKSIAPGTIGPVFRLQTERCAHAVQLMSKSGSGGGGSGAGNGNGGRGSSSGSGRSGSIGGNGAAAPAANKAAAGTGGNGKPPKPASASSSSGAKGGGKGKHSGGGSRRKGGSAADGDDTGSGSVTGGVSPSPPSTPQLDAKTPPFAPSPDPTKSSARAGARVAPFGLDGGKAKGGDDDDGDGDDGAGAGAPGGAGGWNDGAGNARDEKGGGDGGAEGKTSNAVSANTSPALPPANPSGAGAAASTAAKAEKPAAAATSTPAGAATPATPAALAALARPKRKNVNVATVALLYDPPVEGCELKPYVLLKDMEQQRTVGLKSGDELEYKWFRGVKRICSLPKCKNGATLQCLSCVKANGPSNVSYFCSETCLRLAWSTHRLLHQKSQSNVAQPDVKSAADAWNHDDEEYSGKTPDSAQAVSARYPPLISNQWTEASRNRVYSPVTDDVGRCVRLECTYKPGGSAPAAGASSGAAAAAAAGGGSGAAPVNPHADLQEDVLELAGMAVEPSIGFTLRVTPGAAAAHAKRVAEEKAVTPSTPGTPNIPQHTPLQYYNPNIFTNTSNNLWWYDDNDCGGSTGMTPNAWHFMETSPVLPAPTSPPPRHMFWKQGQPSQSTTSFKCLCYNVLAQIYATRQLYPYCAVWALAWNYRKNILLREILSHNADIINLQEVQANHFDKFFQPALSKAGYDGIFKRKNRETVRENPNAIDGCAIFYKRERFALMEQYGIEFNEAARQQTSDRKALRRLLKGNIALVVVLEELGGNDSSRAPRRQRKRRLCVANTHIFWDPEYADVKLWQTWILLQELEKLVLHRNLPLLLCGDFNSMTDSAVYELLANERVSSKHSVFKNDPCQLLPTPNEIASRLPLVSAYSAIGEPKYTNYTGHFVGVLDYIFYSKAHLSCLGCLEVDSEQQLKRETALPNAQYSSDHISLVSELEWLHDA